MTVNSKLEKPYIWFGQMEYGTLTIGEGKHASTTSICIVHRIDERHNLDVKEIENYIIERKHEGDWVIPSEFNGDIVFSLTYMQGHSR
jgi:hypothetical protein